MIKWSEPFYMDDMVAKKPEKWKKRIEDDKPGVSLYCICFASNPKNLFDIVNSNELLFRYYKRRQLYVVGLANSYETALYLAEDMIGQIYKETGDVNIREYFSFSK